MEKGFTLKLFLIVLTFIIIMILIAFFVQRKEKEPSLPAEEDIYNQNEEQEEQDELHANNNEINLEYEEEIDNSEVIKIDDTNEILDVDCGQENYLAINAKQDLAVRLNVLADKIKVSSCQENIFSDYTLGTSKPGEVYLQTQTAGYVIILIFNEQEYRYHGNENTLLFIN